jgi:hypothetical protein
MLKTEVYELPSLFRVGSYLVFFWSNENNKPIHVHVCEGVPSAGATKIWLTSMGGCVLANNDSRISAPNLSEIIDIIAAQHIMICNAWKKHFNVDDIEFHY